MQNKATLSMKTSFNVSFSRNKRINRRPGFHSHNTAEILIATEGSSLITCSGTVIHANAPYVVYYPAGEVHQQDNNEHDVFTRWCFPLFPSDIGGMTGLPNDFFVIELTAEQCDQLLAYVHIMFRYWGVICPQNTRAVLNNAPQDLVRLKHLLLLFLNELKPLIPDALTAKASYINDVCLYITENLHEKITIDTLTERFFVGRTKLTKDFRRTMGMSVVEFVTTVRVNHAKTLLQEHCSLKEIADRCGFSSLPYFIKVFTDKTGLSPTQYLTALDELPTE